MTGIITGTILVVLFLLWCKAKVASKKTVEQRSSLDSILVSIFVMGKKNVSEAANAIRTPEISKDEAVQKTKEAIKSLDNDYKQQVRLLILTKSRLKEDTLPKLKSQPGVYLGKAQTSKQKSKDALDKGITELAELHKKNAIQYLNIRKNALARIEKCEKQLRDIDVNIEMSKATYDSRKAKLDEILSELETTITGNLSAAKFNTNMELIQSLRRETADKLREQNATIEANNMISDNTDNEDNIISSELENEFNNL